MTPRTCRTTPVRALIALVSAAALAACSDGAMVPSQPAGMAISAGDGQRATVATAVPVAPAVRVVDDGGRAAAGVEVRFSVAAGGGSLTGATAFTDGQGVAALGEWRLGTAAGVNEVRASAAGMATVTFSADAVPGAPAHVLARGGDGLGALVGSATLEAPSVRVTDAHANAVAGVTVRFTVSAGGGQVAAATGVTDADGLASAGGWTLGQAGFNQVTASVEGLDPVLFTATARTEQSSGGFAIEVRYLSSASTRQRQAVQSAVARWERIITGDLPDVRLTHDAACGRSGLAVDEMVDDLLIYVDFDTIDGPGKVLGQAGPCFIRSSGSRLPVAGIVVLDGADLAAMEADGSLDDVVLHEIGHVLGIGTLWPTFGLLAGAGGADPHFTGALGRQAFTGAGGSAYAGLHVPVENTGGAGTRDAHWRENVLGSELMTGYISASGNPLSSLTVASLADLGYQVSMSAADNYSVSTAGVYGFQSPEMSQGRQLVERPLPFAPIPVPVGG